MTVYTTMPGGDAGHTQAAASPPEGRGRDRPAAERPPERGRLAPNPRRARHSRDFPHGAREGAHGNPAAESPTGRCSKRVADRRRPRQTRALALAALAAHEGTKEAADSSRAQARCLEQTRPRISSALPARLAVPPLACRSSHPPPPATPPEYSRVQVRLRRPHPRAPKCTKQAGGPHPEERGAGDDPTDRICRGAPSYIIDIYAYAPRISSGPTPRTGYLSDSLTLIPTLRQGSSCRAGRPPP